MYARFREDSCLKQNTDKVPSQKAEMRSDKQIPSSTYFLYGHRLYKDIGDSL